MVSSLQHSQLTQYKFKTVSWLHTLIHANNFAAVFNAISFFITLVDVQRIFCFC